jgi:REP element-mobilizing transposase RayT
MVFLLTWPAYGTWLNGPARGRIQPSLDELPEPDHALSATRRGGLKWPPVRLDAGQQAIIIDDLHRIAGIRSFELLAVVAAGDHVHVLLDRPHSGAAPALEQLVQLIKGALSRRLSVAAGDPPAASAGGEPLAHHKWWTRQYALQAIGDQADLKHVCEQLDGHDGENTAYFSPQLARRLPC